MTTSPSTTIAPAGVPAGASTTTGDHPMTAIDLNTSSSSTTTTGTTGGGTSAVPDLGALKRRQQATWASGDYHVIGTQIVLVAEQLVESLDLRSTDRVLDVATGSGNAALAAARRGATVVGIDYVPALLDRARVRADAEGVRAAFLDGDAEALPFEEGAFDVVSSVFGAMFAPDQERTAAEILRVGKPGGRIGLVAHTPDGFIGELFRTVGRHVPPPAGVASPILWGTEARLRELFGESAAAMRSVTRFMVFRERSPEAWVASWRRWYGPTLKAFEAVGADGAAALEADLLALIGRFNRSGDGTMVVESEYLDHHRAGPVSRLDPGARLILARDRTDRLRAEADSERLAAGARRERRSVAGWEGRPARAPASDRVLALAARLRVARGRGSPVPR